MHRSEYELACGARLKPISFSVKTLILAGLLRFGGFSPVLRLYGMQGLKNTLLGRKCLG
jgi:hypothetical protein